MSNFAPNPKTFRSRICKGRPTALSSRSSLASLNQYSESVERSSDKVLPVITRALRMHSALTNGKLGNAHQTESSKGESSSPHKLGPVRSRCLLIGIAWKVRCRWIGHNWGSIDLLPISWRRPPFVCPWSTLVCPRSTISARSPPVSC